MFLKEVINKCRELSLIKGLEVIVSALVHTLFNSVIHVIIVILLIMFIFSIIGNSLFFLEHDWASLKASMWTLFRLICGDEWPDIEKKIEAYAGSRLFTITFVFIGNIIFANIFTGLIITNISDAQLDHERKTIEEREKKIRDKKSNIMNKKKLTNESTPPIDEENLISKFTDCSDRLLRSNRTLTNPIWIKTFTKTLSCFDDTMSIVENLHLQMSRVLAELLEIRLADELNKKEA